tara:strand:+ start:2468 stop:2845 length:378 start_codon:yes stop_codon:yes gene_type:complete
MNGLAVFIGGGLGSLVRYQFGLQVLQFGGMSPWGTLLANVLATALLLGLLSHQSSLEVASKWSGPIVLLLTTGFCGGFSTFSAFSADTLQLAQSHGLIWAAGNVACNLILCLVFGWWSWAAFQSS